MKLVAEDIRKRTIQSKEEIKFPSSSAYHLIVLTARAKGEKQLGDAATDDEELTLQLDDKTLPKLGSKILIDSPAAINGGRLHNLSKTVYLLTFLQGKDHKLILNTDNPPGTATFERLAIYALDPTDKLTLEPKIQAEDGDRRPWLVFILDNTPLENVNITVAYSRRKRDSDDVKIKIDGQTQGNLLRSIKHFLWYFVGSLVPLVSPTRRESQTFTTNFLSGLHYIEIDADRMPVLEEITFIFGDELSSPKRIPTVDDPKWTGDFYDDTEVMLLARLILGEAENQPEDTKIGVGFTVLNRLKKKNPNWGYSVRQIILKDYQYDGMWNKNTYQKVRDPLDDTSEKRKSEWLESYNVAVGVLSGTVFDTTNGATNFHSFKDLKDFPIWATKETYKIRLGDIYFYELEK
ncbi:cell wall hydrolase [Candidatus Daviesbacteria bacterium]|nr:cell wall hydrolase [Candidatus Daviesbacteria bacterium]